MSAYKSFAVVGGGRVGLPVAAGLATKNVSVIILSRSSNQIPPSGVQLVQVDTSDTAAVTAVLKEHKVDVAISTVDVGGGEWDVVQKPVVDAAKAAALKLYIPGEFGIPTDEHTAGVLGGKNKFAQYVKSIGVPYLRIHASAVDVLLVHVLTALPPSELENRTLRIEGERATLNEIARKLKTTLNHVESVEGQEFLTYMLKIFEYGGRSTGWDEVNKKEGSEGAASGNALWPGHHWKTIEEALNL
ncbi:hypothetical protein B0H16DRAFT_1889188 [Mycena metata]|uniref:NmrA-like domain-containing protein n=1 Tax=Mycena metata TaxID=1033252 RepID=A0AAD7N4N0_9AGAR|nr:hypothetical protein B0H16DRAFT_1889188 [Mycena metata]